GTTDFSLIDVRAGSEGRVQFHRIAVGEHLLLGGDNLDLAVAHFVEQQLGSPETMDQRQWDSGNGSGVCCLVFCSVCGWSE
ncbi:MAG: hypothetical protein ACKPHU_11255, partial [Planctomycetaceae bacterium]